MVMVQQESLRRIVLGVQYDGASWQGWQVQPHGQTVQNRLEEALAQFTCTQVATVCAGRTDSGVHGLEQVVHFDTPIVRDMASWVRGVNAFLPPSISVRWATSFAVPDAEHAHSSDHDFHARFSATARTYYYLIYNHPIRSPLMTGRAGWTFRPLDVDAMQVAAQHLVGKHDFSSFRSVECQAKTPVRTMTSLTVEREGDYIIVTLQANAFLHHMVRNIVGSLIYVGTGKKTADWLADVLAKRDRALAAPTFMPDGLYLARVDYPAQWALPQEETRHFLPMLQSR
jgi:tRNA pseudouridine38-40 synthase